MGLPQRQHIAEIVGYDYAETGLPQRQHIAEIVAIVEEPTGNGPR